MSECKDSKALASAERNRKFEIELYWKRSVYFWTFNALAFAGYGALSINLAPYDSRLQELTFILSNMGFVAAVAWALVNKGSKYWHEYWEIQVERLETPVIGNVYKSIIHRRSEDRSFIPSVSKINNYGSGYIVAVWFLLLIRSCPWAESDYSDRLPGWFLLLTAAAIVVFLVCGRTSFDTCYCYCREVRKICGSCCDHKKKAMCNGEAKTCDRPQ